VPATVQIEDTEVVPNVNAGLGAFDVAASVTVPDPNTALVGTLAANAMVCNATVALTAWVT
jgi:hypothetical protein